MDNVVKYKIFLENERSAVLDISIQLSKYLAFITPLIDDYIWQNDAFCLAVKESSSHIPAHLYGETNFGDNIDDEWFVVYLLCELTKAFPETCVRITDNDGDFLLIEAAHFLPKWLSPETSKNRVFICNGKVHIIPIPSNPGEVTLYPTGTPLIYQALQSAFGPQSTIAKEKIQDAIRERIQGFSKQPWKHFHHAHCFVPAEVKYVLDVKPTLISPIVQAFYHRDPIDVKSCRNLDPFPLKTRLMAKIRFTRCLYAQLCQQAFKPTRWSEWSLPSVSDPAFKAHELGIKLALGFQILYGQSKQHQVESQIQRTDPSGPKWENFLAFLKEQNYFRGELEGSKLYQDLLSRAKRQFSEDFVLNNSAKSSPGNAIMGILKDTQIDVDKMKAEELTSEDDDSWLNLSPEDLDEILASYGDPNMKCCGSRKNTADKGDWDADTSVDLESVTRSMKSFVGKVSSYEGAEFPGECDEEDIQFDPNSFMDSIGKLLEHRGVRVEGSDSDDDQLSDSTEEESGEEQESCIPDAKSTASNEMSSFMDQMDWELAQTSVGQSFEKTSVAPVNSRNQNTSHETWKLSTNGKDEEETADEDNDTAVDVDLNLVKNILESLSTQQGLAGPASNILGSMGVWLPGDTDT